MTCPQVAPGRICPNLNIRGAVTDRSDGRGDLWRVQVAADYRRATAITRSTPRISTLLSCRFLLGWCIGLRCSATEPTTGIGRVKGHNNNGNSNPQALVLKDFHEFLLPEAMPGQSSGLIQSHAPRD